MLRIGFNALGEAKPGSGSYTYLLNLLRNLIYLNDAFEFLIITGRDNQHYFSELLKDRNVKLSVLPVITDRRLGRSLKEQLFLPAFVMQHQIDVLFCPFDVIPLFVPCKTVLIVLSRHMFHRFRSHRGMSFARALSHRVRVALSARFADQVLCISESSRQHLLRDIGERYARKVNIAYLGIDAFWFNPDLDERSVSPEVQEIITDPYILFVGALYPHKNLESLIRAYEIVSRKTDRLLKLVIVGHEVSDRRRKLAELAEQLDLLEEPVFTGYVPDEVLRILYSRASVFVYPSLIEGFGLPILEAMACRTPVIGSNRTSIPEVVGEAGITINPENVEEIAEAILLLLRDEAVRLSYIQKGLQRAKDFSWQRTAEISLEAIMNVSQSSKAK
jgi:glycosyltransferase involved in cell wall biosynthesis